MPSLKAGQGQTIENPECINVRGGFDYVKKLVLLKSKGYHFHVHTNANAIKGPLLVLTALLVSLMFLERAALTFHGGMKQIYFPKGNGGQIYLLVYLYFLLSKVIICNDNAIKAEIAKYGLFIKESKIHPIPAFSVQYMKFCEVPLPENVEKFIQQKEHIIISYIALREGFFIDVLLDFLENINDSIGAIFSGVGDVEDKEITESHKRLLTLENQKKICIVKNLNHDQFMTLLRRSDIFLRSPTSDGVSASVLETLSVGTPVVASENGRRPDGVLTYVPTDVEDLSRKIDYVLQNPKDQRSKIVKPVVQDTVKTEIKVLMESFVQLVF